MVQNASRVTDALISLLVNTSISGTANLKLFSGALNKMTMVSDQLSLKSSVCT
jgi:hypothetical protein